jgi:hypothetical protein
MSHHVRLEFVQDGPRYTDGRLAGIFLNAPKACTRVGAVARDAVITASLPFQDGGLVETLRHALTHKADGRAAGPLAAVLDIVASEA